MKEYEPAIEREMKKFYGTLSEKDQRRYAAIEALKLGPGGIQYVARVLGCHRNTITAGIADLQALPDETSYQPRIRKAGGGRKPYDETYPEIDTAFLSVLSDHTAGDPMEDNVRWTHLKPRQIAHRLAEDHRIAVSETVIHQLLDKHGYRRRQAQKNNDEANREPK